MESLNSEQLQPEPRTASPEGKEEEGASILHIYVYIYIDIHSNTHMYRYTYAYTCIPPVLFVRRSLTNTNPSVFVAGMLSNAGQCSPLADSVLWCHVPAKVAVPLRFPGVDTNTESCCYLHIKYIK